MIPKRAHPSGSVAKLPALKLVESQRDRLSYPLPDDYAQIAVRRLAADMVYSAICDILEHDPEPEQIGRAHV